MKQIMVVLIGGLLLLASWQAHGQGLQDYYSRTAFLMAPAATFQNGLVGFANPANLKFINRFENRFYWNTDGTEAASLNDWGYFGGTNSLGFGVQRRHFGGGSVTDYQISTAFGSAGSAFGLAYGWSKNKGPAPRQDNRITASTILRPFPFVSLGITGVFSTRSNARQGVAALGLRPLGTPLLTVFADAAIVKGMRLADVPWSAGGAIQPLAGLHLVGRYFSSKAFTVGLSLDLGHPGAAAQGHFEKNNTHVQNSYMVRLGDWHDSFLTRSMGRDQAYYSLSLKGRVDYLTYRMFDNKTLSFMKILKDIRAAQNDPRISALALNLSGMRITPENAWEIRQALSEVRNSGKKVYIFIDNVGMTHYHLASVATKIIMDPEGSLNLPGYILGKTYLKGTLDKLGLGFDEWRFFKYKSAAETLSRDKMSDADREQLQAFVDDWYQTVRADVCESRHLQREKFDELVNNQVFFMPDEALKAGLVDTLGRWSALPEMIKTFSGRKLKHLPSAALREHTEATQQWGDNPKIAVVYGLGVCDLDKGIRARWLERVFLKLAKVKSVKAVVFRVDSPGGDGLASDMVAEAIKKCSKKKPVIISQGQVAGSGGYWISMYGDEIVAGPNTITGSIGVIGGWVYDKGIGQKLGMTSDYVKKGAHADLGFGITLPLLNARIPARNLTPEEHRKMEHYIKAFYDIFVKKVAQGRGMSEEKVRQIAQGRIYSGLDGQEIGLVDEIGGLFDAIAIARQKAGLAPEQQVNLLEIPRFKGLFPSPVPVSQVSTQIADQPIIDYLQMVSEHPGKPLPMLLPGTYPTVE